ncbi:MAG: hypothetical protein CL398_09730 [Acidiferrobacteraceae bacterium]|nr:hypothetical protein [Acidiferrobacteraceae bacterium]|tara:strand:- start:308 stop:766 length:459 start_codon:yes stop_codon:yes gene_type:complete
MQLAGIAKSFLVACVLTAITLTYVAASKVNAACPCSFTPATLVEVVDSKRVWFVIDGEEVRVQLSGIYTPNLKSVTNNNDWCAEEGEKAIQAMDFMASSLRRAKTIALDIHGMDQSGDAMAIVYVDGINLGQELLYKYLAVEFEPTYLTWCG